MAEHKSVLVIDVEGNAVRVMAKLGKETDKTEKKASTLGSTFAKIGAAAAVLGVGAIAMSVLKAGVAMEQTEVAFGTMLGSMDKGLATIKELNTFANVTPFNNEEVIKSGRILLTAGIEADKLTQSLKAVGDVAAGTNQPLNEMAAIYAKALNKGKLQAEELNQLSERGVPILKTLADHYKVTTAEILDMGSKGKLTGVDLKRSFATMTNDGGMFFNMMDKQSKTVGGRWSTLMGTLEMLAITIGKKLLPIMGDIVGVLQSTALWVGENLNLIKSLAITVGVLTGVWAVYTIAVNAAAWSTAALNAIMLLNPIGLLIGLIAALTIALVVLWHKSDGFRSTLKGMWEGFKVLATVIQEFVKNTFAPFLEAWSQFKEGNIGGALKSLGKGAFNVAFSPVDMALAIAKASDGIGEAFSKGRSDELQKSINKTKELSLSGAVGATNTGAIPTNGGVNVGKASSTAGKVQGSKQTNISINLNNLVEEFNVTTQNMTEGAAQVKDKMIEALLQVLNESDRLARV
jgi:tape measure domain-containing protein